MIEFRMFIGIYAIWKKFVFKYIINDGDKVRLKCHDPNCKWLCYVKDNAREPTVVVKTLVPEHTYIYDPTGKNYLVNSKWVAQILEEDVKVHHKTYKSRDIVLEVWSRFGVSVSYWIGWSFRWKIMELIHGNYEQSYRDTPKCVRNIINQNPGSLALVRRKEDQSFNGMIVVFDTSLHRFVKACRPLVGFHGCFLKGKFGGVGGICLAICALDGNNGLFPLYIC